jgi:hypothetical protein
MKKIAKNSFYEISVDAEKNCIYVTFHGFWEKLSQVPNFLEDHIKAIKALSPGFTVLANTLDMKIPTKEINDYHHKILKMMDKEGLRKLAFISASNRILRVSGKRVIKSSGILDKVRFFGDIEKAEEWLDS